MVMTQKPNPMSRQHGQSGTQNALNKPPPQLILEGFVLDHARERVQLSFAKKDWKIHEQADPGPAGSKVTIAAPSEAIDMHREHKLEFVTFRRGVLKRKKAGDTSSIRKDNIEHRSEHWRTEWQVLRQGVYIDAAEFDQHRQSDVEDTNLSVNRILCKYDRALRRVEKCFIDGEEVEVEHLT